MTDQEKKPGRQIEKLGNQDQVNALIASGAEGVHGDGAGLWLQLKSSTASYIFRYRSESGRIPELGLGGARIGTRRAITIREARNRARRMNDLIASGRDPKAEREAKKTESKQGRVFFKDLIAPVHARVTGTQRTRDGWLRDIKYAADLNGRLVREITTEHIAKAVAPIWTTKAPTAKKVVRQVKQIIDYAQAHDMVSKEHKNPANLTQIKILIGEQNHKTKHRTALDYEKAPAFVAWLRKHKNRPVALALEFTILTAGRAGETCGATWGEVEGDLWTIPEERMLKTDTEHTVPLCKRALAILAGLKRDPSDYIFMTAGRAKQPPVKMYREALLDMVKEYDPDLDATTHGFRSTFRDWCGDATDTARELAESALSHLPADPVEAAYRRRKAIEKRRPLMEKWCQYLSGA